MTAKSEMKCLYVLAKIRVFYKIKSNFRNLTGNIFKIYSYYLLNFKFDAVLFNLHISCRVYL